MKIFKGEVIAKKTDKTAKVVVHRVVVHPKYKKRLFRSKNYLVHDEIGVQVGQKVKFIAIRPISKLKRWKIVELEKSSSLSPTIRKKGDSVGMSKSKINDGVIDKKNKKEVKK